MAKLSDVRRGTCWPRWDLDYIVFCDGLAIIIVNLSVRPKRAYEGLKANIVLSCMPVGLHYIAHRASNISNTWRSDLTLSNVLFHSSIRPSIFCLPTEFLASADLPPSFFLFPVARRSYLQRLRSAPFLILAIHQYHIPRANMSNSLSPPPVVSPYGSSQAATALKSMQSF